MAGFHVGRKHSIQFFLQLVRVDSVENLPTTVGEMLEVWPMGRQQKVPHTLPLQQTPKIVQKG